MAQITTRAGLKAYCLEKLGQPVSVINVTDDQVEARIDDAVEFMAEYNYNIQEKKYIAVKITQTDLDNNYITLDEDILAVARILPLRSGGSGYGSYLFDIEYHLTAKDLINTIGTGDVSAYYITKQHIATIQDLFNTKTQHEFRRYTDRLHFTFDGEQRLAVDDYIVLEAYTILEDNTRFWNDRFLRNYATLLIQRQWGMNLMKFDEVELPGGVKLNGTKIYKDAQEQITLMEEDAIYKYSEPLSFFVG
jgi:hypothetical protein